MAKTITVYIPTTGDSATRQQSKTVTINNLKSVDAISVNTGTVSHTITGNDIVITCNNGVAVRNSSYTPSQYVTGTLINGSNSFPTTMNYYDGSTGYSGNIPKSGLSYVDSGSYTPADSKTATSSNAQAVYQDWKYQGGVWVYVGQPYWNAPSSRSYNSGGYSGTLYLQNGPNASPPYPSGSGSTGATTTTNAAGTANYSGTVTKPAEDTRIWRQDYAGNIYGPSSYTDYYAYVVTLTYTDTVKLGTVNIKTPTGVLALPVYDLTMADPIFRIKLPNAIGCFELVPVGDVRASNIRVQTQKGLKAIAKS